MSPALLGTICCPEHQSGAGFALEVIPSSALPNGAAGFRA